MASRVAAVPGLRSVKACTECKQAKLRCDSKEKFPNPCSRCQLRQLLCTVDPAFQRTPARKRLEALNKELQELRSQRELDSSKSPESEATDKDPGDQLEDDFDFGIGGAVLNDVLVDSAVVVQVFKIFTTSFRPHLPLLGAISISKTYESHPLLFWTIVVVVLARIPGPLYADLFQRLKEPFMQSIKDEALQSPLPLSAIQALLVLSLWPLPVAKQFRDPSWLYCGIAIQSARYMGLDRQQPMPPLRSLGLTLKNAHAGRSAWLGCFYVGTDWSLQLGLPPPINSESDFTTIHNFLERASLSTDFEALIKIQLVVAKFGNILSNNMNEAASSSIIHLMESELDVLYPNQLNQHDRHMVDYSILTTKLHFYALFMTRAQPGGVAHSITLKMALIVALRLIQIATERKRNYPEVDLCGLSPVQQARCLPKSYYKTLAFATIFLLKFFHLSESATNADRQSATDHILMSHDIFRECSIDPLDEFGRAARVFDILGSLSPDKSEPSKLRMTNRMGVSVLLDALNITNEARGRSTELDENATLEDAVPETRTDPQSGMQPRGQPESQDVIQNWPYTMDQVNSSLALLQGYWDDSMQDVMPTDPSYAFFQP